MQENSATWSHPYNFFFFGINYDDLAMNESGTVAIQSEGKYGYVYLFSAMPTRIN